MNKSNKPFLIIGLGNPGDEYERTYHNAGRLFIDSLAPKQPAWREKSGYFDYLKIDDVVLIKPQTFMNESGAAVKSALNYFKAGNKELLVAHDDSDLPLGTYRFSFGRGSAGHRGVESIIKTLRTKDFWRLRIGLRNEKYSGAKRVKAGDLVLKSISKADKEAFHDIFNEIGKLWSN